MNYLQLYTAFKGLFPKTIKVRLLDASSRQLIGNYKIDSGVLPAAFNKPTVIEIGGIRWQVLHAAPISSDDFLFTKKLTLSVQQATDDNRQSLLFTEPSYCPLLPETIPTPPDEPGITAGVLLSPKDWRQIEFLPFGLFTTVQEEITAIETILTCQPNALLGYAQQHSRERINGALLTIPRDSFYQLLEAPEELSLFTGDQQLVKNGFAVRSAHHTYYCILENDQIHTLGLLYFDYIDEELMQLLASLELLLADWCNARCFTSEYDEKQENEYISL